VSDHADHRSVNSVGLATANAQEARALSVWWLS